MRAQWQWRIWLTCLLLVPASASPADEVEDDIGILLRAGSQASGSVEAAQSVERLSKRGPEILPRLLEAMGTRNVVAANWCRVAYQRIADKELERPKPSFPSEAIERFVRDEKQPGRPRRLALELLEKIEPGFRAQVMSGWLNDPEFRKEAVDHLMGEAELARKEGHTEIAQERLLSAFRHARHSDQVLRAVSQLKSLGVAVDPIEHMGFLVRWHLLGPYDAPGMSGFSQNFLPEQKIDLAAEYPLGENRIARWQRHTTSDSLGLINLIQAIGAVEESVGYAYSEIDSPRDQSAELRCSADDNLAVWLNGERVLAREQWLNGTRLDRFVTSVKLKKGRNRVLVKICQGPHHVDPEVSNNWSFQIRFCDATGAGVGVRTVEPPADGGNQ